MSKHTNVTVTAFDWVPDFAQGNVRDFRVRWALEEAGIPYKSKVLKQGEQKSPDYLSLQPFGQVPVFSEDGLTLFESGAILLHIAKDCPALMPSDEAAKARVTSWVFAALNSLEHYLQSLAEIDFFHKGEDWTKERRPQVLESIKTALGRVSTFLSDRKYLEGDRFTAGDLMMASVLRIARHTDLVTSDPVLGPYLKRCQERPAFERAIKAQMADFTGKPPKGFS